MKKKTTKILSAALILSMMASPLGNVAVAEAAEEKTPAYYWDFESVDGNAVSNRGAVVDGTATLQGTAAVNTGEIAIDNTVYSEAGNHVLVLGGGSKGSSYVDLPSDLYKDVDSKTGLTWSFWMKTDSDVGSYTRVFSSTDSSNKNEFAYAPFANDKVWNLLFDDGSAYRHIYANEPAKNVWNLITITLSAEKVVFYVNGSRVSSSINAGSAAELKSRLDSISSLVNHALGRTYSTWNDADCKVQLDDVAIYKAALTADEVADLAKGYGIKVEEPKGEKNAQEGIYQDATELTQIDELTASSADGKIKVKIWKDGMDSYYYSVSREDKVVLECSALGMKTQDVDLTTGLELDKSSVWITEGKEEYDLVQGSTSHVDKTYKELAFTLNKKDSKITVFFRIFEDGIAYRYEVDGDTIDNYETTVVTGENSEFSLPDKGTIWTISPSVTYEAYEYTKRAVSDQYDTSAKYSTPILASLGEDAGNNWVLLSEANVYNEEEPYCASVFETLAGQKSVRMTFGQYLLQEEDESYDKKTYSPSYSYIKNVTMQNVFHTPWRVAIIGDSLEKVTNSSLITDLNPVAEGDFSWVKPGSSVWSWWSTSADAIDLQAMKDYIDFASNCGIPYCLVDYGWELWDNYEAKIKELVSYADERNVGLLLWYGVNKFDNVHIFDLDSADEIEKAFVWCEEMGVKGVKVDYLNSDSQFAMKVMYDLADIAAKHHLVLNYHGSTNPNGENRTYPNILSSEAVAGAENFKWSGGSSISSLLTLPYTRNVIGSMEFTPTAYRVTSSRATSGFMLAMPVVYESAVQTYAASAYVYPGYNGLSLLSELPASWDESLLLEGYPGESVVRARRSGEEWYLGVMTNAADTYHVVLDFLDPGTEYTAYIYSDNANGTDIEVTKQKVTSTSALDLKVLANGGAAVRLTKKSSVKRTVYDQYTYYEAESDQNVVRGGNAAAASNPYASGLAVVGYVGGDSSNTLTFNHVQAAKAGEHELKVYFVTGGKRDLYIKVNDGEPVKMEGLLGINGDWNAVSAASVTVELKEGDNTICLYNDNGYAPNIDRIAVRDLDPDPADLSGLAALIKKAEEFKLDDYTEESAERLRKVIAEAKELAESEPLKNAQEDVDEMAVKLQNAMDVMEKKPAAKLPFVDVKKTDWHYNAVYFNYLEKTMTGKDATHFAPNEPLARAQFAVILYRMNDTPEVTYSAKFPDVQKGIWYTDAILWAADTKVVTGYTSTGMFGPSDNINREQMAVMMYRYAEYKGYSTGNKADFSKFSDAVSVNDFAKEAMRWAVGNEIITGKNNGTLLDPQGNATRAECATIIMRFMEKFEK